MIQRNTFRATRNFLCLKQAERQYLLTSGVFNKPGWTYGFLIDAAYIADFKNNIEFMISACIYTNSDGILNDDKYDYDTIGYPFLKRQAILFITTN